MSSKAARGFESLPLRQNGASDLSLAPFFCKGKNVLLRCGLHHAQRWLTFLTKPRGSCHHNKNLVVILFNHKGLAKLLKCRMASSTPPQSRLSPPEQKSTPPERRCDSWRSGRDSNPRAAFDDNTISSRARYDLFDTTAYSFFAANSIDYYTKFLMLVNT